MERVKLHCNFSFNYYLNNSIHLIVQDQSETMEFMVITIKRLTIRFLSGVKFIQKTEMITYFSKIYSFQQRVSYK